MGNICHAGPVSLGATGSSRQPRATSAPPPARRATLSFGRDPTLKREDYIFSGIKSPPSCLVKQPGSIDGQQFLIEDCEDCDIFLLDHCTSVQIDGCVDCRIVIGPCESSLFLRNCRNCTIVCAVQQFRTRECETIDVYLYSSTEPIIELSSKMRFACFPLAYFSLQQQFDKAGFSVWNNRWSEIYNFTPDHGSWKPLVLDCHESPLVSVVEKQADGAVALWKLPSWTATELGLTIAAPQLVVPLSSGVPSRRDDAKSLVVVFAMPHAQLMLDFVHAMTTAATASSDGTTTTQHDLVVLIRTWQMKLSTAQAKALFPLNPLAVQRAVDAAKDTAGSVIMEFQGVSCDALVASVLQTPRFAGDAAAMSSATVFSDPHARRMSELVFIEWKQTV